MKRFITLTLTFFLFLASCAQKDEGQFYAVNGASSTSAPSYWPNHQLAFPLQVDISSEFTNDEVAAIEAMAQTWTDASDSGETFFDTSGVVSEKSISTLSGYDDSGMAVYKLNLWPEELPATALAVTQIFGTRKNIGTSSEQIEIEHADILMNYQNYSFTTDNGFGYDLYTVILHEMGHFLGLYHSNSDDSIMKATISRFTVIRVPSSQDIENLNNKYNLNRNSSSQRRAFKKLEEQGPSEKVILRYELYPDGSEKRVLIQR